MKLLDHYASCPGWESGVVADCTCYVLPAFRIRKEVTEQFPWRIWRRTADLTYTPLMSASTWDAAFELVQGFLWLRREGLNRGNHV